MTWVAVAVFTPSMYNGWRQTYFLLCALLCAGRVRACIGWHRYRGVPPSAPGCTPLVGAGIILVVFQMVWIHPYQQAYFNFLVDREETPGRLGETVSGGILGDCLPGRPALADRNLSRLPNTGAGY